MKKRQERDWENKTNNDVMEYWKGRYGGLTRGELHKTDPGVYFVMKRRGLLGIIEIKNRNLNRSMSNEEIIRYWEKNYKELSRSELSAKDSGLYDEMRNRGLLKIVQLKLRDWKHKTDEEIMEFYKKNYNRFTRKELSRKDTGFYDVMKRRDLLFNIPSKVKRKREWNKMDNGQIIDYYRENYLGLTKWKLQRIDQGLYFEMHKRNLWSLVPSKIRNKNFSLEEGMNAYFRYEEKCNLEGKKPTTLLNFFSYYSPETLEPAEKGAGPLNKYVKRYYQEKKKLREKLEGKVE